MVVGIGEICDRVVELLIDFGALFLSCVSAKTKRVCTDIGDVLRLIFAFQNSLKCAHVLSRWGVHATVCIACQTIQS